MSISDELRELISIEHRIDDMIGKVLTKELKEELKEILVELVQTEIGMHDICFEDESREYKNIEFTERGIYGEY